MNIDPQLDLVIERYVDAPPPLLWKAWTEAEHVKQWFTPAPWKTAACDIDLKPGGIFRVVMESPEGQQMPAESCYLEIVPGEKLIWTCALAPGYRPVAKPPNAPALIFTAFVTLEAQGQGTQYRVVVKHPDPETKQRHEGMGFYHGWGSATDQLIAVVASMKTPV